jgi:hypothetical protein
VKSTVECIGIVAAMCVVASCSRGDRLGQRAVIPAQAAAQAFQEAAAFCQAEGGELWGTSLCGPMMFVDRGTRRAVLNGPSPGAVADGAIYRLDLPPQEGVANTSKEIGGQRWTMILWPLPENKTERAILMMHESYHRIQPALGLAGSGGLGTNTHLDTKEGRIWMRAGFHALTVALEAKDEARRAALADALLFEGYRRSLWPDAADQERGLELNEGLAESTGIDAVLRDPGQRVSAAVQDVANCEKAPSLVRSFAYGTGPAYAELLDAAKPEWRKEVRADFDFAKATAAAYGITLPAVSKSSAEAVLPKYGGAEIVSQEEARQKAIDERNARFTALFLQGPTARFPLQRMSITYNPRSVSSFEDHGTVYATLEISDLWGTLKVDGGSALISKDFKVVAVPVASGFSLDHPAGEGWTVSLAKGYVLVRDPESPGSFRTVKP